MQKKKEAQDSNKIVTNLIILSRLHMTEAALALSEKKNHQVSELLAQHQMATEEQREQLIRKAKREEEVWTIEGIIL